MAWTLYPRKEHQYSLNRRLDGSHSQYGRFGERSLAATGL